jgi:hypothetical protein
MFEHVLVHKKNKKWKDYFRRMLPLTVMPLPPEVLVMGLKVKFSLCSVKHLALKTYGGVEV